MTVLKLEMCILTLIYVYNHSSILSLNNRIHLALELLLSVDVLR